MEQSQNRKKKKVYTKQVTALVFLGLLFILCVMNLIPGNRGAGKPKLTLEGVLNGGYMEDYGSYLTDRFLGKGMFSGLDFSVKTLFGNRESEGIYRGRGRVLLEKTAAPDNKALEENTAKIKELAAAYYNIPVYVMLVPGAANIQAEKLPPYTAGRDQEKQFNQIREMLGTGVNWVEVSKALRKHDSEQLYYRTDKCWTSLGAFYGYEALAAAMELDASKDRELTPYVVNNDYIGSLAKKSGYGKGYEDSVTIYAPKKTKDDVRVLMTNMDTKKKTATLYDSTKLEKEDKYSLFLGGDAGMTDIKTTADTTDRLLIFKDSYANCLIPFLTPYYREILAVDPSLYDGNIQEIMRKAKFTSILFLYGGNSFVTDTNISKVLELPGKSGSPGIQGGTPETENGADPGGEDGSTDGGSSDAEEDTDSSGEDGGTDEGSSDAEEDTEYGETDDEAE